MTPSPENGRNFFWWTIGVQNHQGTHQNWFLPFLGAPGGHFSKNPKMDIFQILNFPDPVSQLPLDLESWNFFWYALTLCLIKCSIPLWLVWFGLIWYGAEILKNGCPENTYPKIFDFFSLKALSQCISYEVKKSQRYWTLFRHNTQFCKNLCTSLW